MANENQASTQKVIDFTACETEWKFLERQPDFPKEYLGYATSAFVGGRTSAHIRKFAVPVVYTDFLSMYPTVNCLMDLWRFVIAKEIKVVEHCEAEIHNFLTKISRDELFKP